MRDNLNNLIGTLTPNTRQLLNTAPSTGWVRRVGDLLKTLGWCRLMTCSHYTILHHLNNLRSGRRSRYMTGRWWGFTLHNSPSAGTADCSTLFFPKQPFVSKARAKGDSRTAQGWCFSLQTQKRSGKEPSRLFVCYYVEKSQKEDAAVAALLLLWLTFMVTAMSALMGRSSMCNTPLPDWVFDLLDIHFELESRAVASRLTDVFEVFMLNDPGSPSRQLPYPELGKESGRQPADWAKIVWHEQDLRLTGRTMLTHSNTRWLIGLWVKGVSERRRYWAKSVFV